MVTTEYSGIEDRGGDRTMDDHGCGPDPRPEGGDSTTGAAPEPLPYEGVWRFTAPAVDASVPQARRAVRDLLHRQGVPVADDIVDGLLLIVSELVTNAVKHAALLSPTLALEVAVGAEWVRVSVEDNHPYRPTALENPHSETGGRGLLLVREFTREAGGVCDVEHTTTGGKVIWAALPLKPLRRG
ncbi:ATPase [Streptomyces acidiscabies]|uniref:ATPase n=2 Tax=Streptomyces acidiscabies TaxID=42234 RepID=A0A0L0JHE6_9ACTN|nr:ATPase [Streptomyces acidiscabies]